MIEIKKLSKQFSKRKILNKINLNFPSKGFVALVGASGSGKSTLLNLIGGIDKTYNGKIVIDKVNIAKLTDKEHDEYRLRNIGYVFQNFNLLNLDSVLSNVKLPLDAISNGSEHTKRKRVMDVLKYLKIDHLAKKSVNKLSGGESQRCAIAKAIINSPKILLCDEPTGALDEKNSYNIFHILKILAKNSLVIVATHDVNLVKEFADQIIEIKDGKITSLTEYEYKEVSDELLLLGDSKRSKKSYLPLTYKISHGYHKLKSKKWRFLITNFMLSISLTGIGISLIITNSVNSKIKGAFSSMINANQIVMSEKEYHQNIYGGVFSASEESVNSIYKKYSDDIAGVGANYIVNFENFFKDKNEVKVNANMYTYILSSVSARSFNDYRWIDESNRYKISPRLETDLEDDQVVLALSYIDMVNLCFHLKIQRNYESLANYIYAHFSTISLHVKNNTWQYEDEQIFQIKGVFEDNETYLCHTNKLWNKVVYQVNMRFPLNDGSEQYFPWEMYKLHYFLTNDDPKVFLDKVFYDESLFDYAFERTNHSYNPLLCGNNETCYEKRVIIYYVDKTCLRPSIVKDLLKKDKTLKNYYFLSDLGYSSYANNLLSGFSKNIFISSKEESLISAIDADTSSDEFSSLDISLPDDVVRGNFMDSLGQGVKFSTKMNLISGREPNTYKEIVISNGLAKKLFSNQNPIGLDIYFAGDISITYQNTKKDYRNKLLRVVGVTSESKNYIYHDNDWTISFFRDELGAESFYLSPRSVVFELDDEVDADALVKRLNKMYKDYVFVNPLTEITKSIETTLSYAKTILFVFSLLSSLISLLLLATVILLDILESKEEIKIYKYIGISSKDISSLFVCQSITQTLIAFFFSMLEIIVFEISISLALDNMLNYQSSFSIEIVPILVVFLISIIFAYLVSKLMVLILFRKKFKKEDKKVNY